jgi:hypothetical protein
MGRMELTAEALTQLIGGSDTTSMYVFLLALLLFQPINQLRFCTPHTAHHAPFHTIWL